MSQSTANWLDDDGAFTESHQSRGTEATSQSGIPAIQKPGRYLGGEVNSIVKPGVAPAIALCFPDIYEIGMSHFGLKILYEKANADPRFAAERVFAPWKDKAAELRRTSTKLTSLETAKPLSDFEIIGFSVSYELSYPDLLEILDLGGIPILAADRRRGDNNGRPWPVVIAGGHSALHMAPMKPFLDGVFLGEADEAIIEILEAFSRHSATMQHSNSNNDWGHFANLQDSHANEKANWQSDPMPDYVAKLQSDDFLRSRDEALAALARIEGMLIYDPPIGPSTSSGRAGPARDERTPSRRIFYGFENSEGVINPVVPLIAAVHDRVTVEIMRGCTRGCRFCQAGYITRPQRYRSVASILENTERALATTGHDEVSLISLSSCDHPDIKPIADALYNRLAPRNISISIPSTRVDAFDIEINNKIGSGRRTGITLAPEVGSERMDRVINKGSPRPKLIQSVEDAFAHGWKSVKLYYLIGIPFETLEDARAIGEVLAELAPIARKKKGRIHASISIFCPKPWTPFQWVGMENVLTLREKMKAIRAVIPSSIKLDIHDPECSLVESALARAGEEAAAVIEKVWRKGATLQAWSEHFDLNLWKEAYRECGTTIEQEAYREYDLESPLPWEDFSLGVDKEFLVREWHAAGRAAREESKYKTEDCSTGLCANCGMPCIGTHPTHFKEPKEPKEPKEHDEPDNRPTLVEDSRTGVASRIAFSFSRNGSAAAIGHLDMLRLFERAVRRAKICGAVTAGFNPRLKLRFGQSLPLGVVAENEYAEIDVYGRQSATLPRRNSNAGDVAKWQSDDFLLQLNAALPPTIRINSAWELPPGRMPLASRSHYRLDSPRATEIFYRLSKLSGTSVPRVRKGRSSAHIFGDSVENLRLAGASSVELSLIHRETAGLSIGDILGLIKDLDPAPSVTRTHLTFVNSGATP